MTPFITIAKRDKIYHTNLVKSSNLHSACNCLQYLPLYKDTLLDEWFKIGTNHNKMITASNNFERHIPRKENLLHLTQTFLLSNILSCMPNLIWDLDFSQEMADQL